MLKKEKLLLFLILLNNGCEKSNPEWRDAPDRIFYEDIIFSEESAARFTKRAFDLADKEVVYISDLEFYSQQDPLEVLYKFKHRGPISGGKVYIEDMLSPDKEWIVLQVCDVEGFVYCKTDEVVDCVKNDCYEGRFHLDFIPPDPEGVGMIVRFLRWEAPATFVFYEEDREYGTGNGPLDPSKDVYKINLHTGEFTLPQKPSLHKKPYLYKEKE